MQQESSGHMEEKSAGACPKMLPAEPKVPAAVPKMLPLDAALVAPAAPLEAESEKIPPLLPLLAVKMLLPEADRADEETPAEPVEAGADEVKIPPLADKSIGCSRLAQHSGTSLRTHR